MKVQIQLTDLDSFTREEAIEKFKSTLGKSVDISVYPETDDVRDILRFALQQMVGYDQLCLLNDSPYEYKQKIEVLHKEIMSQISKELSSIIVANEIKFGE
jgi:hypothetical protein